MFEEFMKFINEHCIQQRSKIKNTDRNHISVLII
jgi:hypothetical protein